MRDCRGIVRHITASLLKLILGRAGSKALLVMVCRFGN